MKAAIGLVRTMAPNITLIGAKELEWNVRIMGAQTFYSEEIWLLIF